MRKFGSLVVVMALGAACSSEPVERHVSLPDPPPTPTVVVTVYKTVPGPPSACPSGLTLADFAKMLDGLEDGDAPKRAGAPAFRPGLATLRVGVMHSKKKARVAKKQLADLLDAGDEDWLKHMSVWGTKSRHDKRVRARLDVKDVDPAAGAAFCEWLDGRGWDPGAVPCEIRKKKPR